LALAAVGWLSAIVTNGVYQISASVISVILLFSSNWLMGVKRTIRELLFRRYV
jgi:hypothetical protein